MFGGVLVPPQECGGSVRNSDIPVAGVYRSDFHQLLSSVPVSIVSKRANLPLRFALGSRYRPGCESLGAAGIGLARQTGFSH